MTRPLSGRNRVYIAAGVILVGTVVFLRLAVPEPFGFYVHNGLMLPVFRYGLLFTLIGCGVVLSGVSRTIPLVAFLTILGSALWFGLHRAEAIVLSNDTLTELIENYPVMTTAMGTVTGAILLCPVRVRRWFVPIMCICCGLSLGLFIILESPLDNHYIWFSWAGGLGGMTLVLATIVLIDVARRLCAGTSIIIAERIFGSWLIAASVLLAALAVLPQRPFESVVMSFDIFDAANPLSGLEDN